MKKFIGLLLIIAILTTPISVFAENIYVVPGELVQIVNDLIQNAQTPAEFKLAVKMHKMISDPETITCGEGIDPNGRYNYGKSIYEKVSTDGNGNVLWKRTGYK